MKAMALTLLLCSAAAFAQNAAEGEKPADGAIIRKGDPVLPGETSGTPDGRADPSPSARGVERCKDFSGTLLEQCLEQERKAGTGATRAPGIPPPQNPRQEKP
ncbi:MAG: hypothetical protein QOD26_3911 [Betaproteobacteria bacterium]|jgi:hypothetical protein|nr:hypothetical protein [Betaproteobacteria bacterium]